MHCTLLQKFMLRESPDRVAQDKIRENIKLKYIEKKWFQHKPAADGEGPKDNPCISPQAAFGQQLP